MFVSTAECNQKTSDIISLQNNNRVFASNTNNTTKNNKASKRSTNTTTADSSFFGNSPTLPTDNFFAEFNDNFNKNKNDTSAFDAFGETDNKVSTGLTTITNPSTSKLKTEKFEDEFAVTVKNDLRFDAFKDASKSLNDTFSDSHAAMKNAKFEADYSKGETFDSDLNEIIKRSLVDQ